MNTRDRELMLILRAVYSHTDTELGGKLVQLKSALMHAKYSESIGNYDDTTNQLSYIRLLLRGEA